MTPEKLKRLEKQILSIVLPNLVNNLHRKGTLNDTDLNDKQILNDKLRDYIAKNKLDFQIVVDHRETLLNVAEREFKAGHNDFSIALFATYIEHSLNRLIHLECERKKLDNKTCTEIIKSVGIIGKCTWLLKLLGLQPFRQEYLKIIFKITEERNAYIHYKWKPERDTDEVSNTAEQERKEEEKYKEIKKLMKYLKSYETRHEFAGKKNKIRAAVLK